MATERQIAANQANAKRSSGPKTRAGKRRASQNAYHHGLSARVRVGADWFANVEALARDIVDSMFGQIGLSRARSIAEAECEVRRVRSMKNAVVRQILVALDDSEWSAWSADRSLHVMLDVEAEAVRQALPILQRFDRYERRVTARRNRAIRLCFEKVLGDN